MDVVVRPAPVLVPWRHHRRLLVIGCAAGIAATALAAALGWSGGAHPVVDATARSLMVGVPIAVGLYAWQRRPDERLGALLVAAGAGWLLTTLAESDDAWLYTLGRAAGWLVEVLLVYLFLSFPTGRLPARIDRLIVLCMVLVVVTGFLPRLALAEDFPAPTPYTSCVTDCPPNALLALDREPAFVDGAMEPAAHALLMLVMVAVILRLQQRVARATPLARRTLLPVLAAAIARTGLLAVGVLARAVDPTAAAVEALSWALAFAFPAVALAFLAGVLRWRLFAGRALHGLATGVRTATDATTLRRAFARTFDDPSIELAFPVSGGDEWVDCEGRPFRMQGPTSRRSVTDVRNDGRVVAAIVHDPALDADPALLEAGTAMAAVALDNQRLVAEADAAMREVRESRARIAAGALDERRRIERDLHDGAQQRLVALRIELELAESLVRSDPERGAARLRELEDALDDALEELRALAHGVYPPLLGDLGLVQALQAAGRRSVIPFELEAHDIDRAAPEVESAVYFCLIEALQNVQKHARGASRVVVDLDGRGGDLRFSMRDDGAGVAHGAIRAGAGITNMRDRVAALGGDLEITSTPRRGTIVRGRVPWVGRGGVTPQPG